MPYRTFAKNGAEVKGEFLGGCQAPVLARFVGKFRAVESRCRGDRYVLPYWRLEPIYDSVPGLRLRQLPRFSALFAAAYGLFSSPLMAQTEEVRSVQNIFNPTSTPAQLINDAGLLTMLICLGIFIIVTFLLFFGVWRYRRRGSEDDTLEPPQVYGSTAIELAWTVPPIMIVIVLVLVTARTVGEIQNHQPTGNPIRVRVVGHRFWWEYQYTDDKVTTANELNVPVSYLSAPRPVELTLESADVVHGFWVPELSGKLQAVPNHSNSLWLQPSVQGTYVGNCTVLCGEQHANMLLRVIVRSPDDFQRWLDNEKKPAQTPSEVDAGRHQFLLSSCGSCHAIKGTEASGTFGPDLTHFGNRETLGSGVVKNDESNLRAWLRNPQAVKPGCLMPNMQLNETQLNNLLAYLKALK